MKGPGPGQDELVLVLIIAMAVTFGWLAMKVYLAAVRRLLN